MPGLEAAAPTGQGVTLDAALEAFPPDLQLTLAELAGAPDRLVEVVLGLLPTDSRDVLAEYQVVQPSDRPNARAERLALTDFGRRVIDACAAGREQASREVNVDDLERRAKALSERVRSSDLPMRTREAKP
jgi:hypothetical protein